jgi:ABC-type branched-subunit amino acid transport system substrate-binding protein
MQLAGEGTFERNTVAVKAALLAVKKAEPQAVIMISPYKPAAEFIKLAKQIRFDPTFVNISFVGSDALAKELGPAGAGVVITQVVPFPKDVSVPVVGRYQAALKASAPELEIADEARDIAELPGPSRSTVCSLRDSRCSHRPGER